MKNKKISLESQLWTYEGIKCPFELISAFFDYSHLDEYKTTLNEAIFYIHKKEVYKKEYPGQMFSFYNAVRSFLKACYLLQFKSKKWKVKKPPEKWSILNQASLTYEEYQNPFLVFQLAFTEKALEEYEFFLREIIDLSLSPCTTNLEYALITPYIFLVKMLDAAQVISERGILKKKK
ncbi:hypothetical protein KB553_01700 [Chryseobacterium rhizoplanae]|uniref:hypothetical protein n=1 Tax=Chryseobacterium rhizoplanae TaxID=1609531 RepID=UPI001CE2D808|nr:hypothetical protein [Chryseobacterium rhizoplanae]UCA60253.1 hypothetical protein KB553_01700 [Chryseobacterium rhizoplanae]